MAGFSDESTDLSRFPELSVGEVEKYARQQSGCESTAKAYKFCAEPGYLHNIKGPVRIDNSSFVPSITIKEGEDVVLNCNAFGKPPFVWRWLLPISIFLRRSKQKILKQIRRGENGQLIITSAKKAFQGKYKCTVYNAHGKTSAFVSVRVDRNKIECDGTLKIRPNESKLLRSPFFYSHAWEKVKRKCIWKLCPSRGWKVMVKMMIVYITFSTNRYATWQTLNRKQKPALSMDCGSEKKPSCGSIEDEIVTSDCKSGCVKIVYRPRYIQKSIGHLRLNVWVGTKRKESQTNNADLRSLYCDSDFVVKARIKSVRGNKKKLYAQILDSYKPSSSIRPKRRYYFAVNSSIAGHPIFDCMAKYNTLNILIGRKKRKGTYEVIRVISNRNISSELVQLLKTYKNISTTCSLRD